eukprot:198756_1
MGCIMDCIGTVDRQTPAEHKRPTKLQFQTELPHLELPFNIQTPPIVNNKNQVIFLATTKNVTQYITFDLTTKLLTTDNPIDIECNDSFDMFNTVYTFNPSQNKIYFIENNKDISTLDLNSNSIKSLNKSIETTNGNFAAILYSKITDKMYIFGAEKK